MPYMLTRLLDVLSDCFMNGFRCSLDPLNLGRLNGRLKRNFLRHKFSNGLL